MKRRTLSLRGRILAGQLRVAVIRLLACAVGLLLVSSLGSFRVMAQADPAQQSARSSEQLQAEARLLEAEAKYHRELWEKLQAENHALRAQVSEIEAPVRAKESEATQRKIELNAQLYAKYVEAKQREYDFVAEMMAVHRQNFQHQYVASYVVLALVVCIVLSALWFAHVQLMAGLAPAQAALMAREVVASDSGKTAADASAPEARQFVPPPPPQLGTSIDASLQKVTVTSSVVGVIVLIISLAFLYIYTKEIYTIRPMNPYKPVLENPEEADSTQPKTSGEKK